MDCDIYARPQEALRFHRNALLAPTDWLRLARCVVDDGWPLRRAVERFQVSHITAARCNITASTAHRILTRRGLPALATLDRATGEPVRRYERARPGELLHIDVKKLGRIPDGGGHKALGRAAGCKNRTGVGLAYLHTAAYAEGTRSVAASPSLPHPPPTPKRRARR